MVSERHMGGRLSPRKWMQGLFSRATSKSVQARSFGQLISRLEGILEHSIVDFWLPRSLDHFRGGYLVGYGSRGEAIELSEKSLVAQSRMLYFWSRLARSPYLRGGGNEERFRVAADVGYTFLRNHFFDESHGGFFWSVTPEGTNAIDTTKNMYGQSFAIYALAEYARLTEKTDVSDFLLEAFHAIDTASHDSDHGGYPALFDRDWTAVSPQRKSNNVHLHLLESFTNLYLATRNALARDRLWELMLIQSNTVVRKGISMTAETHDGRWRRTTEGDDGRVSFGHDLENIWLLMDASDALDLSPDLLLEFHEATFAYALAYGYDRRHGGFHFSGEVGRPADNTHKVWWVQAEAMLASLRMFQATHDERYFQVFLETLDFVETHVIDPVGGEWFPVLTASGALPKAGTHFMDPMTNKGDPWKVAYHNGRAIMECLDTLNALSEV